MGKYKTSYNTEYIKPDELTGQQTWIDASASEYLEILQKENIQEIELKNDNYDSQNSNKEIFENSIIDFTAAKMKELQSWISNKVYDVVSKTTNKYISIRWVLTTKQIPNGIIPKAWLIARGFKEDCLTKPEKESPTCSKGSLCTLLSICAQNYWKLHSIVIKTAFLQGNLLTRDIFINPPPEASCPSTCT